MKIYYYTSTETTTDLLVEYISKPYLVRYYHPDDQPIPDAVTELLQEPGDTVDFAFQRFLKFALVPWYEFDEDHPSYDLVMTQVKALIE